MSYLIKWKLEKLLKRRDFGEIMQKTNPKKHIKIPKYANPSNVDIAPTFEGVRIAIEILIRAIKAPI